MDDMDVMLGSWGALNKTTKLLSEKGATAENWMIHTPVCCPSRAELVTARFVFTPFIFHFLSFVLNPHLYWFV
jgi:arylsulfatase A-like enzyme